jgi:peptidoglycan/LPS O-acetylase OafA/YrhL
MRFLASPAFLLVPLAIFAGSMTGQHPHLAFVIGFPVANVATALAIDWAVTYPAGVAGRVLNSRPLVFVGLISYSLYLWQQPFLNRDGGAWWNAFPSNVTLACALALASYYVVERPSLSFRRLIERRRRTAPVGARVAVDTTVARQLGA